MKLNDRKVNGIFVTRSKQNGRSNRLQIELIRSRIAHRTSLSRPKNLPVPARWYSERTTSCGADDGTWKWSAISATWCTGAAFWIWRGPIVVQTGTRRELYRRILMKKLLLRSLSFNELHPRRFFTEIVDPEYIPSTRLCNPPIFFGRAACAYARKSEMVIPTPLNYRLYARSMGN